MDNKDFSRKLIDWYLRNKRDLPWRDTSNPYHIWVSEVILQQTRVDQGMAYYHRFIEAFPDIASLAYAENDQVMRLWQGLGYYSRARNMHLAAKQIMEEYGGAFPGTYLELLHLKGVGTYTAAAISSIAFRESHAVIDGNVFRFLARHFGVFSPIDSTTGKKEFSALAESLLYRIDPGTYNQAIMEFGALVCRPVNPSCTECVFRYSCQAKARDIVQQLPVKEGRTKVRERYLHFLIYRDPQGNTLLEKRAGKDIWEGLYQFPLAESNLPDFSPSTHLTVRGVSKLVRHQLTHQRIFARFWHIETNRLPEIPGTLIVTPDEIDRYALPRVISRYLEKPVVNW